jgi:pilus assembly protein CpaB
MNKSAVTLSALMGGLAYLLVDNYISSFEADVRKKFDVEVFVFKAREDIKEQSTLLPEMVERVTIPKNFIEPGAVTMDPAEEKKASEEGRRVRNPMEDMAGSVVLVPIRKGEQITLSKITEPGIRSGLSPQIAPGKRAVSIPVGEVSGVAKLVKPGDRVDVIAVIDAGGGKENKLVRTLLQDVAILAVGRNITNNAPRIIEADPNGGSKQRIKSLASDFSFASVTLEVEPAQAQTIALVLATGEAAMTISLRNNDDSERPSMQSLTLSDVLGSDAGRVLRAPAGGATGGQKK